MDYSVPPIPPQTRRHARRGSQESHYVSNGRREHESSRSKPAQPASPEVISSLISSLSVISQPASTHFDHASLSLPTSPSQGSFGVDYGAFSTPSLGQVREEDISLDELAASPPVIRTSKPPSGFSPLTAPKSPKTPHREASNGLKSLLRSSRPSSRGSASSHDDTRSIGALSIERGVPPTPELKRQRSHDSWGKKSGRNQKGLMYMSSKERLRVSDLEKKEKKRVSVGAVGGTSKTLASPQSSKPDAFLAETAIHEEPAVSEQSSLERMGERSPSVEAGNVHRPIPTRESSLRKTGSNSKRSSQRNSRSKRVSDGGVHESIPENEENNRQRDVPKRRHQVRQDSEEGKKRREDILRAELPSPTQASSPAGRQLVDSLRVDEGRMAREASHDLDAEEGAPSPAVAQGRRRTSQSADRSRRRSGRNTPDPLESIRPKRSSSRLKRLSGASTPRDEKPNGGWNGALSPDPRDSMNVTYERPLSADSVDDAVESYLCSPRLSQKIRHPQTGRVISFSEVGDSEGYAVFCCVGMGLTRYITAFYDELALTLKLRLITPDRPGVGDSEPYTDGTATPLSWPDDVYAICQALKITKFSILAHSAGAIYALATALRMPQHIRGRIHLLAPWIPPSQMNVFGNSQASPPTNAIPTSQRILRALPTPFLKAANSSFMTATSSSITSSLPKSKENRRAKRKTNGNGGQGERGRRDVTPSLDKENLAQQNGHPDHQDRDKPLPPSATENMDQIRPADSEFNAQSSSVITAAADAMADKERQMTYDTRLTHAIWDLATTGANPAVDLLVCLERRHTIGFRYVDITRPVVIHHGSRDTRVPVENVRWLGKTMRRCEVRVLENEGHGLMASAGVMGSVLMEISKEWEDWMRVTGNAARGYERGRTSRTGVR